MVRPPGTGVTGSLRAGTPGSGFSSTLGGVSGLVKITCSACRCEERWPGAWGVIGGMPGVMDLEAALILREGWGLGWKRECTGCPCHTGEGILPQLMLAVD
jgi:hypothetical protein